MTVFTRTWDGSYEAVPANTEGASLGGQRIRETRVDVSERMKVDHSWAGTADDGEHKKITFAAQIADPAQVANKGFAYIKDVSGVVELFFRGESGVIQITSGGAVNVTPTTPYVAPAGTMAAFAGSTAPSKWLLCYGQAVSRTTYADLFTAIGTTYGAGDGSTTFNLPDCRGRVVAGLDNMGGTSANRLTSPINGDTLGAAGGAEGVVLTMAQLPADAPTINMDSNNTGGTGSQPFLQAGGTDQDFINNLGSGEAHPNVQPTIIMNYIISTGGVA